MGVYLKKKDKITIYPIVESEVFDLTARVTGSKLTVNGVSDIEALKKSNIRVSGNSICVFRTDSKGVLLDNTIGIAESGSTVVCLDNSICYAKKGSKVYGHDHSVIIVNYETDENIFVSDEALILFIKDTYTDSDSIKEGHRYLYRDIIDETLETTQFAKRMKTFDLVLFDNDSGTLEKGSIYFDSRYLTSYRGFFGLILAINKVNSGNYAILRVVNGEPIRRVHLIKGINLALWDTTKIKLEFFRNINIEDDKSFRIDVY